MEALNQVFGFISKLFEWWFTVMPWEQGIFIRAGKHSKVLPAGLYFKIPFVDRVYVQPIRLRILDLPAQTISTLDGKTITIKASVAYSIKDILKMFNTISHPEMTLSGIVMAGIAEHIKGSESKDTNIKTTEDYILKKLDETDYGLGDLSIKISTWVDVKTFRLIQDHSWMQETLSMDYLGQKH